MWKIDSGSWNAGTAATVSAHGTYTLTTRVVDDAGNFDDHSSTVKIDTVAPRDDTTVPAGWQLNSATITLDGFDADSGVATIEYQVDSGPVIGKLDGDTINVTANGTHTLTTTVVDNAGNRSTPKVQSFSVDSLGPNDLTTVPTGWVTDASSTPITVQGADTSGSGVVRTEYKLTDM